MMGKRNYQWTDDDVLNWAFYYVSSPWHTTLTAEMDLGVSHSTIWWCFMNRLIKLDKRLYDRVVAQMNTHSGRRARRSPT